MLDSLKETGKNFTRGLGRTWENLKEGWHELLSHSNDALTHFARKKEEGENTESSHVLANFPRWSLLAGEVEETDKDILVRIEVPGIEKENLHLTIDGNMLYLSGEKHIERESSDSTYHVMERAYGSFQRVISLPSNVNTDQADANYKNGVLSIRLPKEHGREAKSIPLS